MSEMRHYAGYACSQDAEANQAARKTKGVFCLEIEGGVSKMFDFAGSMSNSAPVTRVWQIGETCYQGQLLMSSHADANCYGASYVMDVAGEANEDNHPCIGMVSGVHTTNDAGYSGTTGYGDTATRRDRS